jgi:small subunit ribosomal protein S9
MANQVYYYALGRRKASVATIRLYEGEGLSTINGKNLRDVYPSDSDVREIYQPITAIGSKDKDFYFTIVAKGGGVRGQVGAIKLALARALVKLSEENKPKLKPFGLLTRDPRVVERKKVGLVKARKAPQFSKR